jgi:hypothetical protein
MCLSKAGDADRKLIMVMAHKMASGRNRRVAAKA